MVPIIAGQHKKLKGVVHGASSSGQCLGAGNVDPTNAFRIGADGLSAPLPVPSQTLAQPYYPGVNGATSVGDVTLYLLSSLKSRKPSGLGQSGSVGVM